MITQYYRPSSLNEVLQLLEEPGTQLMGGGTTLSRNSSEACAVIDLQDLGLDGIKGSNDQLQIGATTTLQGLADHVDTSAALRSAIKLETPVNIRNMGTVAGTLVTSDGRSPFAAAMLALDANMILLKKEVVSTRLGDFLPLRRSQTQKYLITRVDIPLTVRFAFEWIGRTPGDRPVLMVALAQWPAGRTRLVIGGWGDSPAVAMDGNVASGVEEAARNAANAASDQWATAEYRSQVAAVLAKRCLAALQSS